ncbi:family 43 glycosylhydrolase [Clostridium tertium]|uniref:family 43 glycosylhydrolase n=1 Tax=Clostridium TaxID=1485 RepID=UPI00163DCA35|nr:MULTISPECIES: family 43 glycosylhydrolase [Clostridium]MDB1922435.1 family 43 glycosylhydrolase [Clostridium tertium]MDB1926098.1 family 43 glycosylhydrolase [Clostridium tertium]MDB1929631.1 family 43 glycosylhydrolase [Clostridium tertium]MDB1969048.1 family 43 glycosylhydrolase [Clostridium tertium]MDU2459803.1 family 43 glycosylhydrolase [Clostridium sp.]
MSLLITTVLMTGCTSKYVGNENNINVENEYLNSFTLEDEWEDGYGIGDPYILRYDGRYYLYVSTHDYKIGVKCWSSDNLVDWKYEGLVTEEKKTLGAYAPEVIYWDGYFYMYTSPAGKGHYVLQSDSPTGPFKLISDNIGMSIDGSVFIDDNAKWYFYYASPKGIMAAPMKSPTEVEETKVVDNTFMNWWTEGPSVIKRDDIYYMTYTGNHVKSTGYRVNYSTSVESPITGYKVGLNNPILINTSEDFNALGHSSSVLGPDLDSYYITYHNLVGEKGFPLRKLNIDRLVFNGEKMSVLGPTNFNQPSPNMPQFYTWVNNDTDNKMKDIEEGEEKFTVSNDETSEVFTAEFSFSNVRDSNVCIVTSYKDSKNYGEINIDIDANKVSMKSIENGNESLISENTLPYKFDFSKMHTIRIKNNPNKTEVLLDNIKVLTTDNGFKAGSIGYKYAKNQADYSFLAFTNESFGTSDSKTIKAIPGRIDAIHYSGSDYEIPTIEYRDSISAITLNEKGKSVLYNINIKEDYNYGVDAIIKSADTKGKVDILVDGKKALTCTIDGNENSNEWLKKCLGEMKLKKGYHQMELKLREGALNIESLDIYKVNTKVKYENNLSKVPSDAEWNLIAGWTSLNDATENLGDEINRAFYGNDEFKIQSLSVDFALGNVINDVGIYFNATNESVYKEQVTDSMFGYYLQVQEEKLTLYKLNYGREELISTEVKINQKEFNNFKIEIKENTILVKLNDEEVLSYDDLNLYTHGKIGFRADGSKIYIKNLEIK